MRNNTNRVKVHAASAGMFTVLTIDIRTAREMILLRFSEYVSFSTVSNSCILATLVHDCDIRILVWYIISQAEI